MRRRRKNIKAKTEIPSTSTSGPSFSQDELDHAILEVEDIMDRAMCPYLLLGETARSIHAGENLQGDQIEVGVNSNMMTVETTNVFRSYAKELSESTQGLSFKAGNVPVKVHIINNKHDFFEHPDTRFYLTAVYKVPNPFNSYWKSRSQIK